MDQYVTQIRNIQNQFIITKAILDSEVVNAQLMVAIKQDLNAEEDINDLNTRKGELQTKVDNGQDDAAGTAAAEIVTITG